MHISMRAAVAALAFILPCSTFAADRSITKNWATARSRVIVLAHRACWGPAPEVSIAAIEHCTDVGADAVEIDVRKSRDGVLVLMHDDSVDRTTNGKGAIADMAAADIRRLRLRAGAGGPDAPLTAEHVPTLEDGLRAARRAGLLVNVHLKMPVESEVAALVKRLSMVGQVTTWVTTAPDDAGLIASPLRGVIGIIPAINDCGLGYPAPCWPSEVHSLEGYAPIHPVAFFLDFRQTHDFIQAIASSPRPAGTRIFVETLNRVDKLPAEQRHAEWRWLLENGVGVIMTDQAGDLLELLRAAAPRH